ncbi:hypothetical protein CQ040_14410 [Microbacterium sp. MYb54]|nr:hypothetical protein CQ032_12730 [Microbacterium sp. MYb43]PRB19798.1 hypothetical protein CQ040_14410 [Microbacterium sp. MYb54]PRB25830.1 hypothetical protein CQ037_13910 [Microbacterium sp. MYb50]PRB64324.1 hypothetical protein CQ021_14340 [Microbacterium sp. MYb24]PRB73053.1 hypothetical protein CQ027_13680 [Microbacterium sp. MYb32]
MGVIIMTGCTVSGPAPQGQALFNEAEENYLRYRGFVNELQTTLADEDWKIGQLGVYGMQPVECDGDDQYRFDLNRSIELDGAQREAYADSVEEFLTDNDMTPQRRVLGEDGQEGQLIQLTVRDEGDFSLLLVEIRQDGRVRIAAETACWPGDRDELSELLFHGERLGEGYLPTDVESPTDPLFFGITPGDPQFVRDTPAPTETPAP